MAIPEERQDTTWEHPAAKIPPSGEFTTWEPPAAERQDTTLKPPATIEEPPLMWDLQ